MRNVNIGGLLFVGVLAAAVAVVSPRTSLSSVIVAVDSLIPRQTENFLKPCADYDLPSSDVFQNRPSAKCLLLR